MPGGTVQDSQREERTGMPRDQTEGCASKAGPGDGGTRVWN